MKTAIILLTCGRPDLTRRTIDSLWKNGLAGAGNPNVILISGHDGNDHEGERIAFEGGFSPRYKPLKQLGIMAAMRALMGYCAHAKCDRVLWLENDWEVVAPIPLDWNVECVRLYGAQKQRDGTKPAGTTDMATGKPINWQPAARRQGWEGANAHWGGPPSITKLARLLPHLGPADSVNDLARRVGSLATLRPVENIVWHLGGAEQTKDFRL